MAFYENGNYDVAVGDFHSMPKINEYIYIYNNRCIRLIDSIVMYIFVSFFDGFYQTVDNIHYILCI